MTILWFWHKPCILHSNECETVRLELHTNSILSCYLLSIYHTSYTHIFAFANYNISFTILSKLRYIKILKSFIIRFIAKVSFTHVHRNEKDEKDNGNYSLTAHRENIEGPLIFFCGLFRNWLFPMVEEKFLLPKIGVFPNEQN